MPTENKKKLPVAAIAALLAGLQIGLAAGPAKAGATGPLQGLSPLGAADLAAYHGGFELPNGVNINVGIVTDVSVNGALLVQSQFSTGSIVTPANLPSISAQLQTVGGLTQVLQLAAGQTTVIANTANNTAINQLQTITVDIANFSKFNPGAANGLVALGSQIRASMHLNH
ncbi:MAG TPA: hypothetical protein VMV79_03055 [Alphaproteobacteria bacterium]|nr:hypothetical protein [Alphaproteobacteria bacterium]